LRRLITTVAAIALVAAVAQPSTAGARAPDRVCGIEPGEGSFNYVQTWGMSCKRARQISRRAGRKFCGPQFERCSTAPDGEFEKGIVEVGRWTCKMRVGYEYYRARCFKRGTDRRFVHRSGS
jgi:hypothetical protein